MTIINKFKAGNAEILIGVLISIASPLCIAQQSETLVDMKVGEVRGEPVLRSEIMDKLRRGQPIVLAEYPASASDSDFVKSLQDEFNMRLLLKHAEEIDIEIDDAELDADIDKLVADPRRNLTMEKLKSELAAQGVDFAVYREDYRKRMILSNFQGRVILPLVKVTDREVEARYRLLKGAGAVDNTVVDIQQVVMSREGDSALLSMDEISVMADVAYTNLKSGQSIQDIAKNLSAKDIKGLRVQQSELKNVRLADLASDIRARVDPLSQGEFTAPTKIGDAFYIFYVGKRGVGSDPEFDSMKPRIFDELRSLEAANQTIKWLEEQRRKYPPDLTTAAF